MSNVKFLLVGDPHFKSDNEIETDLMTKKISEWLDKNPVDFVVVLGDTLHKHSHVDVFPLIRATAFLQELKKRCKKVYLLIGNHDRPHNNIFLTQDHPFNSFKLWDNFVVVDDVLTDKVNSLQFLFVPYVPNGRLDEALKTKNLKQPLEGISCVFSHQEYKGSKLNKLTRSDADTWDEKSPMNFSGHIHEYEEVQPNLVYVGTPVQHGLSDMSKKTISYVELDEKGVLKHEKIDLNVPKKIVVTLTPEELLKFEPPTNTKITIKLVGTTHSIHDVLSLNDIREKINRHDIKIIKLEQNVVTTISDNILIKTSFSDRLKKKMAGQSKEIQLTFQHLFGK
jgi:DNA repair exonuclease SbcCD nuclease subunit